MEVINQVLQREKYELQVIKPVSRTNSSQTIRGPRMFKWTDYWVVSRWGHLTRIHENICMQSWIEECTNPVAWIVYFSKAVKFLFKIDHFCSAWKVQSLASNFFQYSALKEGSCQLCPTHRVLLKNIVLFTFEHKTVLHFMMLKPRLKYQN